eukprot:618558-Prymnesium_polylepis.1
MSVRASAGGGHGVGMNEQPKPVLFDVLNCGFMQFHSPRAAVTVAERFMNMKSRPESAVAPVMHAIARLG